MDWTNFVNVTDTNEQVFYYSFKQNAYLVLDSSDPPTKTTLTPRPPLLLFTKVSVHSKTTSRPKSFANVLHDPEWGEPARSELTSILEIKMPSSASIPNFPVNKSVNDVQQDEELFAGLDRLVNVSMLSIVAFIDYKPYLSHNRSFF